MIRFLHNRTDRFRRFLGAEDGAALVEFALLLPLMLVLFALIAEGGRLFWSYQNAITGVRDTARHLGRMAPADMCAATPSAAIGDYTGFVTSTLTNLSSGTIEVGLDRLGLECVGAAGDYRVSPAPVAVVTATLTITDLPFAPLFQLVGGASATRIETTITDRSRVFGP
ncbi:TadE/TadG family type IV pilus assembly protein [Sedimentitalea sp. JM2-8]|uniref:TadE/TadG family type IV pilus assembly protein n=1 Tax=Sedimentitalea xiamensis TaxID=3050037 RepID=A0ABT7FBS7_9RHOB|nr:TadE/TadG family type IV pilus assembly protein [Sedimentitalea xiamensis]MDK3072568.1 TadE/TadG family type IV pilus assembly protein [Sedimentitalea xiamensis]